MDAGIVIDSWAEHVPRQQRQQTASWSIPTEEIKQSDYPFCLVPVKPHLDTVSSLGPQIWKDIDTQIQQRANRMLRAGAFDL